MAEKKEEKIHNEESSLSEEERKSDELLKDSVRFEDFIKEEGERGEKPQGEISPKMVSLEEYQRLENQLKETKELLLRVAADFDNFKKRAAREKEETIKFSNEALLRDMLETADNLELTLAHSKVASVNLEEVIRGFEITVKGFMELLKRYGVTPLDVKEEFDPNFHEAIGVVESEEIPAGRIVRVERKGYMLKDRLLRPALVVVSKGKAKAEETKTEETQGDSGKEEESSKQEEGHRCIAEPDPDKQGDK